MLMRGSLPLVVFLDEYRLLQREAGEMFGVTQGAISAMVRSGRECIVSEMKDEDTGSIQYLLEERREIGVGTLPQR